VFGGGWLRASFAGGLAVDGCRRARTAPSGEFFAYNGFMHSPSLPASAAPFFQEYRFEELDVQVHRDLIIERILAWGNRVEIAWVFHQYGRDAVATWVQRAGNRLPARRLVLFRLLLNLPEQDSQQERPWKH